MAHADKRHAIFITGGASGIGLATARLFAKDGWFIGVADINTEALDAVQQELSAENCMIFSLDVRDKVAFDTALQAFGEVTGNRLHVFFNNAGIGVGGPFAEMDFVDQLQIIDVNLIGVLNGIHAALPLLKNTENSLCFNTSSSSAIFGMPNIATYSATKKAVKGLTEALSIEFATLNIRVSDVLPGLIDTPLLPEGVVENAPKEGAFRAIPPSEVACAVRDAWNDTTGKIHWFVPSDLEDINKAVAISPESVRAHFASEGILNSNPID
ncbi:MAG: SDR family oxidoreductase [Parvularculales bacterium]